MAISMRLLRFSFFGLDQAFARSRFFGFGWVSAMRGRVTMGPPTELFICFRSSSLCRLYSLPLSSRDFSQQGSHVGVPMIHVHRKSMVCSTLSHSTHLEFGWNFLTSSW